MAVSTEEAYRATARRLADAHRHEDPATKSVYLFPDPGFANVRLLEVSGSAPRSGDVLPFAFAPHPESGVAFPSTVILLSPDEWEAVEAGTLELPPDWDFASKELL